MSTRDALSATPTNEAPGVHPDAGRASTGQPDAQNGHMRGDGDATGEGEGR